MPIKCFFLEPAGTCLYTLRRYSSEKCHGRYGYHDARTVIGEGTETLSGDTHPHDDPRWPKWCSCGYVFHEKDHWMKFRIPLYVRVDTREKMTLEQAPAGAMWFADWMPDGYKGSDDHALMVRTPGGDWAVDSRAPNCTLPHDNEHRCWVRHGTPPDITVDKNDTTCSAGAGSIAVGKYHGFLRDGYLTD